MKRQKLEIYFPECCFHNLFYWESSHPIPGNCMWSLFKDFSLPITDKTLKRINAWQRKRCFSFFSARSVRWCFKNSHHSSRAQNKLDKRKWSALQLVCNHLFSPLTEGILFKNPLYRFRCFYFRLLLLWFFDAKKEREWIHNEYRATLKIPQCYSFSYTVLWSPLDWSWSPICGEIVRK